MTIESLRWASSTVKWRGSMRLAKKLVAKTTKNWYGNNSRPNHK